MNKSVFWFGAIFQLFNIGLIGFMGLIWLLVNLEITTWMIAIFCYVVLNIASLFCIIYGLASN